MLGVRRVLGVRRAGAPLAQLLCWRPAEDAQGYRQLVDELTLKADAVEGDAT